jgi:hypothetical protein
MRTRREFLLGCSGALAGAVLVPANITVGSEVLNPGFTSLDQINYSLLAEQVKTRFLVRLPAGPAVELILIEAPLASPVRTSQESQAGPMNESFSLIFSGPQDNLLESRLHFFEHARLGRFEMHVGPIGRAVAGCVYYEAVVNRPAPVGASPSTDF